MIKIKVKKKTRYKKCFIELIRSFVEIQQQYQKVPIKKIILIGDKYSYSINQNDENSIKKY